MLYFKNIINLNNSAMLSYITFKPHFQKKLDHSVRCNKKYLCWALPGSVFSKTHTQKMKQMFHHLNDETEMTPQLIQCGKFASRKKKGGWFIITALLFYSTLHIPYTIALISFWQNQWHFSNVFSFQSCL